MNRFKTSGQEVLRRVLLTWTLCTALPWMVCGLLVAVMLLVPAANAAGSLSLAARPVVAMVDPADDRRRNGKTPDSNEPAGSYARFSSNLQSEKSNADQQRECRDLAALKGHRISPELEFSDSAVSGTRRRRAGLDAMLAAARAGQIKVLYFHSLSRLSRESVITLPLLKDLVYNYGVRIISVTEGIDSDDTAWELIAHIMSIVHEQYLKDLAANVHRGQAGTVLSGLCVGDYCFGFASVAIPGSEQGRGRNAKPRMMYVINPETAAWVPRIFNWFVCEGRSLRWIVRELNRLGAPNDHRAFKAEWRHAYVARLLQNRKYIGEWRWGELRNVRDPLTGKIRQKNRSPEESEQWRRSFPHLRLIDDETFAAAQRRLEENKATYGKAVRKERGRFSGTNSKTANHFARHLLQGLIQCAECGHKLYVWGTNGKYLCCPGYHLGSCTCKTGLRRDLAKTMILEEIGQRMLLNLAWREIFFNKVCAAWEANESHLPADLAAAERALAEAKRAVENLVDQIERGIDVPEIVERLTERRAEKRKWTTEVERLRLTKQTCAAAPTPAWVDERLAHLGESLRESSPAAAKALADLVGGQIVVTEIRKPGRERYYWQGRFTISITAVVRAVLKRSAEDMSAAPNEPPSYEIVIDFREPHRYEIESETAKELWDKGWLMIDIAREMKKKQSYVRKLIKYWFESRQLPIPDGRGRRSTLAKKHQVPPMFESLATPVEALLKEGLLIEEIAERVGCCTATVAKVIDFLRAKHGLSIPDGRTRRKSLDHKVSQPRRPEEGDSAAA
jgi:site-specific DNA recombinase